MGGRDTTSFPRYRGGPQDDRGQACFGQPSSSFAGARFGAPGLDRKRKDLAFAGLLGSAPDPAWSQDLDQAAVLGHRFVTKIAFLHRPSGTLILGDLCFRIGESAPRPMRAVARATGAGGPSALRDAYAWLR